VYVRRHEARNVEVLTKNLHLHLPAVRVARKSEWKAFAGRHWEHVRIMREQDIERDRRNQSLRAAKVRFARSLIIDACEIQPCAAESQEFGFLPKEPHSEARALHLRVFFAARIDLVISHASENAGIAAQPR